MTKTERQKLQGVIADKKARKQPGSRVSQSTGKSTARSVLSQRRRESRSSGDDDDPTGLDAVSPDTHPARDATHFRRIVAAAEAREAADQELRDAIAAAREAGDSWTVIGAALGTSRQNAFQRFGRS